MTKWSFEELQESQTWNDRPTYMVYYSHGLMGGTLEFYVDLQVTYMHLRKTFSIEVAARN